MFSPSLTLNKQPNRYLGLVALGCGFFMVLLDSTVLNVALPAIGQMLKSSLEGLQWIVNSYTLLFASLLLMGGTFADRYGARRVFCLGLVIFLCSSLLCSFAISLQMLIGARVLQGIGAAILLPASLSLISHLFTEPQERAKAVSIWAGIASLAVVSGPLLGGLLVETLGWRSVFLVNLPFGILALLLTGLHVPATPGGKARRMDLGGQILAIVTCATFTYGLIEWNHSALGLIVASFLVALGAGGTFLWIEMKSTEPMLPLDLLHSWNISAGLLIGLLYQFSFYGMLFVFSLFFQSAYHFSALAAGLSFLPANAVGSFLLIFVTGRLMRRFRLSTLIIAAMTSGLVGMVLIWLGVRTTFPVIMGGEVLFGAFAGLTASPVTALVMVNTPKAQAGIASGLLNAARQVGGMLGVAVLGTALGEGATGAGIQVASWIIAGACFVGLLLSINLAKRLPEK